MSTNDEETKEVPVREVQKEEKIFQATIKQIYEKVKEELIQSHKPLLTVPEEMFSLQNLRREIKTDMTTSRKNEVVILIKEQAKQGNSSSVRYYESLNFYGWIAEENERIKDETERKRDQYMRQAHLMIDHVIANAEAESLTRRGWSYGYQTLMKDLGLVDNEPLVDMKTRVRFKNRWADKIQFLRLCWSLINAKNSAIMSNLINEEKLLELIRVGKEFDIKVKVPTFQYVTTKGNIMVTNPLSQKLLMVNNSDEMYSMEEESKEKKKRRKDNHKDVKPIFESLELETEDERKNREWAEENNVQTTGRNRRAVLIEDTDRSNGNTPPTFDNGNGANQMSMILRNEGGSNKSRRRVKGKRIRRPASIRPPTTNTLRGLRMLAKIEKALIGKDRTAVVYT